MDHGRRRAMVRGSIEHPAYQRVAGKRARHVVNQHHGFGAGLDQTLHGGLSRRATADDLHGIRQQAPGTFTIFRRHTDHDA